MGKIKTKENNSSVEEFLNGVDNSQRREDSFKLLKLFEKVTGKKAKMWGTSIVGFGKYHYKSERSSQEGDWPLVGFSPRKQNLTLYIMVGFEPVVELLKKLGKHKTSVSCLYINGLKDIDVDVLKDIIRISYKEAKDTLT